MIEMITRAQAAEALEQEMRRPRKPMEDGIRGQYTTQALQMAADALKQVGWRVGASEDSQAILRYLGDNHYAVLIFSPAVARAFRDGIRALERLERP